MENIKISVIIPVHNGEKLIKKTVEEILKQTLKEIEIILVENFSQDRSNIICKVLASKYFNVIAVNSYERGTSFARKKGVEKASGEYIIFSDQDDEYKHYDSLKEIYFSIRNSNAEIGQFGFYKRYNLGIEKKTLNTSRCVIDKDELYNNEIKGVFGNSKYLINTTVWNKVYHSKLIKSAVKNMNEGLFFAEDEYLNINAFFDKNLRKVAIFPDCHYVWRVGVGFSSTDSGIALLKDYNIVKPLGIAMIGKFHCNQNILYDYNIETIYLLKMFVENKIKSNDNRDEVVNKIARLLKYECVKLANSYISNYHGTKVIWDELKYLTSDITAEEYYNYCKKNINGVNCSLKDKIKKILKKVLIGN